MRCPRRSEALGFGHEGKAVASKVDEISLTSHQAHTNGEVVCEVIEGSRSRVGLSMV